MKLAAVAPAFAVPGPVASVYRDASRTTEDAEHRLDLAWRSLRGQLAHAGADEATLGALDEHLAADRGMPGIHGQAVFAAEGRVLLDHDLADPPPREQAVWAALPRCCATSTRPPRDDSRFRDRYPSSRGPPGSSRAR
jgi:hypothetical protein